MDWPDNRIFSCPLCQFKLGLIDRASTQSPSINGPARKTVDEQVRPNGILPTLSYEAKCSEVRIPFFFQQGALAFGGAHLVQKPPECQIVPDGEGKVEIDDAVGGSTGGAEPDFVRMGGGLLERIGFPV